MITAILPCWKRFRKFEHVIKAWLSNPEINEAIVVDNSGQFKTNIPNVLVISFSRNIGPQAKYTMAQFAKNDIILFSDDDVLVGNNIISKLLVGWNENIISGVAGAVFTGNKYYESARYRGWDIKSPVMVDYLCGLTMLIHRKHTFVDMRECPVKSMDDWWLQHKLGLSEQVYKTGKSSLLIPVIDKKDFMFLPEDKDKNALHLADECKISREKYFKEWIKNER